MISIIDKKLCVGCNACTQICPKHCIVMQEDYEGFIYPKVEMLNCVDCGLCEQVCPVINQYEEHKPLDVYAAKNNDERIREQSSSGGIFTLLAEQTILQGGVVFGAGFNADWVVEHSYVETIEGLSKFRGSKYVQSFIGESFKQVASFLKANRLVLFSGTPCQVAGLKHYLRKSYSNLLTVDFVCHGVPSPKVFRLYLDELIDRKLSNVRQSDCTRDSNKELIQDIQFRNKSLGWKQFSFTLTLIDNISSKKEKKVFSESISQNIFLRGFLTDLYLRPSCHACPSKKIKSGSDITIGDFWGIEHHYPSFDDNKGSSLVLVNSELGRSFYNSCISCIHHIESNYNIALEGNPSLEISSKEHPKRYLFFEDLLMKNIISKIKILTKPPLITQIISLIYPIAKKMGLIYIIKKIK